MSAQQWEWIAMPPQTIGSHVWQARVGKRVFMVVRQRIDKRFYTYVSETNTTKPERFGQRCHNLQQAQAACQIKLNEILRMQSM